MHLIPTADGHTGPIRCSATLKQYMLCLVQMAFLKFYFIHACLSILFHLSPYFTMLLNPPQIEKCCEGAREMSCVLHAAWSFISARAGGWLHSMLCEWCLSGSVLGGCFSKVEDIAPCSSSALGQLTVSHTGTVNKHGVAWCEAYPQATIPWGPYSTAAPTPVFVSSWSRLWCHMKEQADMPVTAACSSFLSPTQSSNP